MAKSNLLEETIEFLRRNSKSPVDVIWVGSEDGRYWFSWEQYLKMANRDYDCGFGGHEVVQELVVVGNDWWLERGEYDGSEWWEFKTLPKVVGEGLLPKTLFMDRFSEEEEIDGEV